MKQQLVSCQIYPRGIKAKSREAKVLYKVNTSEVQSWGHKKALLLQSSRPSTGVGKHFPEAGQRANASDSAVLVVSGTVIQLHHCCIKPATDNAHTGGHGSGDPVQLLWWTGKFEFGAIFACHKSHSDFVNYFPTPEAFLKIKTTLSRWIRTKQVANWLSWTCAVCWPWLKSLGLSTALQFPSLGIPIDIWVRKKKKSGRTDLAGRHDSGIQVWGTSDRNGTDSTQPQAAS